MQKSCSMMKITVNTTTNDDSTLFVIFVVVVVFITIVIIVIVVLVIIIIHVLAQFLTLSSVSRQMRAAAALVVIVAQRRRVQFTMRRRGRRGTRSNFSLHGLLNREQTTSSLDLAYDMIDAYDAVRSRRAAIMHNGGTALHPYPAAVSRQKSIIPCGHLAFEKYFSM